MDEVEIGQELVELTFDGFLPQDIAEAEDIAEGIAQIVAYFGGDGAGEFLYCGFPPPPPRPEPWPPRRPLDAIARPVPDRPWPDSLAANRDCHRPHDPPPPPPPAIAPGTRG